MATMEDVPNFVTVPVELEEILNPDGKCVDPAVYVQSPEDNKKIDDEEAGKLDFDAITPEPDLDTESYKGHTFDKDLISLSTIYGNNVFELEVEKTCLFGVLKELPQLSLKGNWQDNAVAHIIDSLKNLQSNTKVQLINSIFGVAQIPWIAGGDATTQSYTGCEDAIFNLQFRIYSMEAIGPSNLMSGYKRVLAALCLYAPPLHTFNADQILSLSMVNLSRTATALIKALNNMLDFSTYKTGLTDKPRNAKEVEEINTAWKNGVKDMYDMGSAAMSAFRADNSAERTKHLKDLADAITNAAEDLKKVLVDETFSQNDKARVDDPVNWYKGYYGGALWHLSVLPGIFSHKIPVYVKSWTVKPSKEIDSTGKAAYMDFTVTCVLDQTKTGNWWANEIYAPEADAYKNYYRQQVKVPN